MVLGHGLMMLLPFIGFVIGLLVGPYTSSVSLGKATYWSVPAKIAAWASSFAIMTASTLFLSTGGIAAFGTGSLLVALPLLGMFIWVSKYSPWIGMGKGGGVCHGR